MRHLGLQLILRAVLLHTAFTGHFYLTLTTAVMSLADADIVPALPTVAVAAMTAGEGSVTVSTALQTAVHCVIFGRRGVLAMKLLYYIFLLVKLGG